MPGKRKANDMSSSEPEEKLSKKAKLKLARERAAAFAKRDKEKIQKAKKGGASSPKAAASAQNNDMAVESPSPAKKSPDKKLSLSERKKIAQQNAKEFAARDKANLKSKKKAASPSPSSLGAAIDSTQVQAYEQMRQMQQVVQQQQQQLIAQQQMLMQKSPINSAISVDSDNEKEIEEDVPPPPPALMAQVSQQVLLNAKEKVIDSEDEPENAGETSPMIPTESSDVPKTQSTSQPLEATKPKSRWLPKLAFLIVVAAVAVSFVMLDVPFPEITPSLPSPTSPEAVPEIIPCYFNSDEYEEEESCANDSSGIPCPRGGVCEGGKLIGCDNSFQAVSERGGKCVLGEDYIAMKIVLMDQLVHHSSKICDHSSKPSFKYTMVQKSQPEILAEESEELIDALKDEGFVVYERDGLYVGLPEDFEVKLPLYCTLGNIGQWLLQEVGLLLLGVLRFAATNFIGFVSAYPKPSGVIFVLYILFSKIRRYRANKKKLQEDIIQTRKIAYKTLEESSGVEHCATHIRDEIAMALYPDSKKLRLELQKRVWPKIVDDVKRDTRVRKFQTLNRDGKTRDMWQWTAATKKA
mmetsp:Transcript_9968/g.24886  ORF Transcript_9968/g.24886 Transcript_9968/m.24886 type:complete len:580 (+) Transcript_9968:141-1880(+)